MNRKTALVVRVAGNLAALAGALLIVFGQGNLAWLRYVGIVIAVLGFIGIVASGYTKGRQTGDSQPDEH